MTQHISSTQNVFIKTLMQLKEKSRARRKTGLFIIEGYREVNLAMKGNYTIKTLLFNPDLCSENNLDKLLKLITNQTEIVSISKNVYKKLAHRDTTEGILALGKAKTLNLMDLNINFEKCLILVSEAPEKPGNIGALLRTADAAKVDAVIIANPKTDMYNPNIIRSSIGCVFTNQIATGSTLEIINFLKKSNINIYCAALQASTNYHTQDYKNPSAIVVGNETIGLSDEWLQHSTKNIIIPMQGQIDSMNVSVTAGILIFEAKRQRQFN